MGWAVDRWLRGETGMKAQLRSIDRSLCEGMAERHTVESPKSLYLILRVVEYVYNMHACHVMHQGKGRGKRLKR